MITIVIFLVISSSTIFSQQKSDLKVFISVDMEGITGVVNWEEVNRTGDWELTFESKNIIEVIKAFYYMH